jgi:hypothetical protein
MTGHGLPVQVDVAVVTITFDDLILSSWRGGFHLARCHRRWKEVLAPLLLLDLQDQQTWQPSSMPASIIKVITRRRSRYKHFCESLHKDSNTLDFNTCRKTTSGLPPFTAVVQHDSEAYQQKVTVVPTTI